MEIAVKNDFQDQIANLESAMLRVRGAKIGHEMDDTLCPLKHTFVPGMYIREIFMPKGTMITSKIHKIEHPYFVMEGKCSVQTEEGLQEIEAPYQGITKAGTKRAILVHEDTRWITIHSTNETDLEKIEEQIIAKDFNDPALVNIQQGRIT